MFRMTTLKISLFSALATLFLLVAMLASTGTASAHTASCQPPACTPHPQLAVYNVMMLSGPCKEMTVKGVGFAPGPATLAATRFFTSPFEYPLLVMPNYETASTDGIFSSELIICGGAGFGSPHAHAVILVGTDSHGATSNQVLVK